MGDPSVSKSVNVHQTPAGGVAETASAGVVWRFDEFELDTAQYELRGNGAVIRIEPQVFDVLTQLVANRHRLVSKEELFDSVWGGRFVGEAALTSRIKAARRALGDDGEAQSYIRTVRSRAQEWGINPERIGIMGFSAGGELAAFAGSRCDRDLAAHGACEAARDGDQSERVCLHRFASLHTLHRRTETRGREPKRALRPKA